MQGEKSIGSVLKRKYWVIDYFKGPYLVWSFSNLFVPNEEVFTVLQDIKNSFPYILQHDCTQPALLLPSY